MSLRSRNYLHILAISNMSTPQAGPVGTPAQLAEEQNYITWASPIGEGTYATVYFSIPKDTANEIISAFFDSEAISREDALRRLLRSLQATKISKGMTSGIADKLDFEILILRELRNKGMLGVARILKYDQTDKTKSWYTIELLTGRTFGQYCDLLEDNNFASFAPVAFGWHILLQLTEALLGVHFGVNDGQPIPNWHMFAHRDIHPNNMLFRGGRGAFKDYPDIALIDFGRAQRLDQRQRVNFFKAQRDDIKQVIQYLVLHAWKTDSAFNGLWDQLLEMDLKDGAENNQVLKKWMEDLRDRARRERDNLYVPLHRDVVQHFEQEAISEDDLWKWFDRMHTAKQANQAARA